MKKWEKPNLTELNHKFTNKQDAPGWGNGETPSDCYCYAATGNNHNHGAQPKKCPCCAGLNQS